MVSDVLQGDRAIGSHVSVASASARTRRTWDASMLHSLVQAGRVALSDAR
jgi:hypothetical protein